MRGKAKITQRPILNSEVTEQIFIHCRGFSAAINVCIPRVIVHPFQNARVKITAKSLKLTGYRSNVPSAITKLMQVL